MRALVTCVARTAEFWGSVKQDLLVSNQTRNLDSFGECVCLCVEGSHAPVCADAYGGCRSVLDVVLRKHQPYFLKWGLSSNLEFSDSARLAVWGAQGFACLHFSSYLDYLCMASYMC